MTEPPAPDIDDETTAARRPGRPVSAEKQQAMREAAIAEFTELGFDNASVDAIAARAQVSKRTLYNHFPNKEELFRSLVSEVGRRISMSATIEYSPSQPLRAQVRRFVSEAQAMVREPKTLRLVRAVLAEHIRNPERVEPILQGYWRREYGFADWAQAACADGRLRGDPARIAHALGSIMRAHVFWPALLGRLDAGPSMIEGEMDEVVDMFLRYYEARG
jgi:TetR/AcrR family transcriptional regulator of autoinduction and epiphytic fitness